MGVPVFCSVDGCDRVEVRGGYCDMHYQRVRKYGDATTVKKLYRGPAMCSMEGCDKPHYGKGFCRLHYKRAAAGVSVIPCVVCGGPTAKAGAKYCGRSCRMKWHRKHGCYSLERLLAARDQCRIAGCDQSVHGGELCRTHYMRFWRHGDPLAQVRNFGSKTCSNCGAVRELKGSAKNLCGRCYQNQYYHANNEAERARRNARRSYLKRLTPAWADIEAIRRIYALCPPGHEVDHVIPVRGRRVTGLHVESNLQYLPVADNRKKLNTFLVH